MEIITCKKCNGVGTFEFSNNPRWCQIKYTCDKCNGSGKVAVITVEIPSNLDNNINIFYESKFNEYYLKMSNEEFYPSIIIDKNKI